MTSNLFKETPLIEKNLTLEELKRILNEKRNKYNAHKLDFLINNINNRNDILLNVNHEDYSVSSILKAIIKQELYLLGKQKVHIKMNIVVKMLFGSRLYGTNTPDSDTDYKGIYLPSKEGMKILNSAGTVENTGGDSNKTSAKKHKSLKPEAHLSLANG